MPGRPAPPPNHPWHGTLVGGWEGSGLAPRRQTKKRSGPAQRDGKRQPVERSRTITAAILTLSLLYTAVELVRVPFESLS